MITKLWGKADQFDLVFSNHGNNRWTAIVPADMEDGQYIVELYAEDDFGNLGYWTGILYISNSANVAVRIVADKFKLWMMNEPVLELQKDRISLIIDIVGCIGRR